MTRNELKEIIKECIEERNSIDESYIIPEKDFKLNISDWDYGTPLWITGSSGDGKSTLARKLKEENESTIITSTDALLCRLAYSKEKWNRKFGNNSKEFKDNTNIKTNEINPIMDYIKLHKDMPYGFKGENSNNWGDKSKYEPYFKDMFKWLIKETKHNPKYNKFKIIIEGCDICDFTDPEYIATQPLIIVGGSRLRSSIRRIKRDIKEDKSLVDAIFREIRRYNSYVKELDDSKDNYKNKIKEIIKECIEELEISF